MKQAGWILLVLAGAVLAALYLWARPQPQPAALAVPASVPTAPVTAREFEFEIAQGKIRGPLDLTANQGQRVTLRVRSDVADELHVHGYDLGTPLPAGESVALTFIAARAGRFEIELHHAGVELGAVEIQPNQE